MIDRCNYIENRVLDIWCHRRPLISSKSIDLGRCLGHKRCLGFPSWTGRREESSLVLRASMWSLQLSRTYGSGYSGLLSVCARFTSATGTFLTCSAVNFDLDDGPVVSGVLPPLILYPTEAENLSVSLMGLLLYDDILIPNSAFSSFPDSLQFDQGSQIHSFRIREEAISIPSEKRPASIDGFIYGFSHFTQRRDSTSKRGYEQVIVTDDHVHVVFLIEYPVAFSCDPHPSSISSSILFCVIHYRSLVPKSRVSDARSCLP